MALVHTNISLDQVHTSGQLYIEKRGETRFDGGEWIIIVEMWSQLKKRNWLSIPRHLKMAMGNVF